MMSDPKLIYLIGSLKNPRIPEIAAEIRTWGHDVFEQWHAAGPDADRFWQEHFQKKGYNMRDALQCAFPQTALNFDRTHLDKASVGVLVMPASKSGFAELGRMNGQGKPTFVYMDGPDPEKWDLMLGLFTDIAYDMQELERGLRAYRL